MQEYRQGLNWMEHLSFCSMLVIVTCWVQMYV